MKKITKEEWIEKAKVLGIDISGAKNNKEREALVDAAIKDINVEMNKNNEDDTPQVPGPELENMDKGEEPIKEDNGEESSQDTTAEEPLILPKDRVLDLRLILDKGLQFSEHTSGKKSLLYMSLFKSKAWLGKVLGEFGEANPYITEKPITAAVEIPKTADVFYDPKAIYDFNLKSELERVLKLRDIIGDSIKLLDLIKLQNVDEVKDVRKYSIAMTQSYVHMCEARFELGFKLSQIRTNNE